MNKGEIDKFLFFAVSRMIPLSVMPLPVTTACRRSKLLSCKCSQFVHTIKFSIWNVKKDKDKIEKSLL